MCVRTRLDQKIDWSIFLAAAAIVAAAFCALDATGRVKGMAKSPAPLMQRVYFWYPPRVTKYRNYVDQLNNS